MLDFDSSLYKSTPVILMDLNGGVWEEAREHNVSMHALQRGIAKLSTANREEIHAAQTCRLNLEPHSHSQGGFH